MTVTKTDPHGSLRGNSSVAIINDTHYGVRGNSEVFFRETEEFFEYLIDDCADRGIKELLHLGDFFDNRKNINVMLLQRAKTHILDKLSEAGIRMTILYGNHDVYYKNTNEYNSIDAVFDPLYTSDESVVIIKEPCVGYGGKIAMVPWITEDNANKCTDFIANRPAPILVGHFEIEGFRYLPQSSALSKGIPRDTFKQYDIVLSGHYHTKSVRDNITYLGTQMQFTWADVDDKKYYHILDLNTNQIESVEYKQDLFIRCDYNDQEKIPLTNLDRIKNLKRPAFVRVVVQNKKDAKLFERVITNLNKLNVHSVEVIENFSQYLNSTSKAESDEESEESVSEDSAIAELIEDTAKLIETYVDEEIDDFSIDKKKLKEYIHNLYQNTVLSDTEK